MEKIDPSLVTTGKNGVNSFFCLSAVKVYLYGCPIYHKHGFPLIGKRNNLAAAAALVKFIADGRVLFAHFATSFGGKGIQPTTG